MIAHLHGPLEEGGVAEADVVLRADVVQREIELGNVPQHISLVIVLLQDLQQVFARVVGEEGGEPVVEVADQHSVLLLQRAGVLHDGGGSLNALGAGELLHQRVVLAQAQILPQHGGRAEGGLGVQKQGRRFDLGPDLLDAAQQAILEGGEHDLILHVGIADGFHHPLGEIGVPVQVGLELDVQHLHIPAHLQHLVQGGDLFALILGAFPLAEIQLPQLGQCHIVDVALHAGVIVGEIVVGDDQLVVLGELYVALDAVGPETLGQTEGRQRVFGCQVGRTAVRNDDRTHKKYPSARM